MKTTPYTEKNVIKAKTTAKKPVMERRDWWNAASKMDLANQVLANAGYLKQNQNHRITESMKFMHLYGNVPLSDSMGLASPVNYSSLDLPKNRPTMNVIQSCVDTLTSRLTQNKPRPIFLTDNGDTKMRSLAKQLNQFILGEFYQTKAYQKGAKNLTDACVIGTGCVQVYEDTTTKKVALDRCLSTELYVDQNDSMFGDPRQLFRFKLVDRSVALEFFPDKEKMIMTAEKAYPDSSSNAQTSISDQIMLVEAWHLPSGKDANDGLHPIVCSSGVLNDDVFKKQRFPFAFMHYTPGLLGFWAQGLADQLKGTQLEINKLLITISRSINLLGVPRIFLEDGSKVSKAHFNNEIGAIIPYRGTKPIFEVAQCMAPEVYAQLQRLVEYAYQQSGISALSAQGTKPSGLNSGASLREFDNIQSDRFASLQSRYDDYYIDLAHLMIEEARDIALRDGSYQTVYPDKDGTKEINLPAAKMLDDPFVIRCYDTSSLPKDPAGRKEYVVEMMQAGIYSPQEGRRLLGFADTEQVDKLETAAEERILQYLDAIVEDGKYTPPDTFMDLQLALKLVVEYYNLYVPAKLSEEKAQLLRDFKIQIEALVQAAMPPPMPMQAPGAAPQATPEALPQNPMMPHS